MSGPHRTVHRIVGILEAVAVARTGISLASLTLAVEAPKSTVHGFVRGLVDEGYLVDTPSGYVLGPGVEAVLGPPEDSLVLITHDALRELAMRTGETVTLGLAVSGRLVYVQTFPAAHVVRFVPRLRDRRPLLPTSCGKILAAPLPDAALGALPSTATQVRDAYLEERPVILRDGLAFNLGQTVPEIGAVAAGVERHGKLVAAVSIAGPLTRTADHLEEYGALALEVLADADLAWESRGPAAR